MLDGKVIAITRDEESARDFINKIESKNGKAIALPTITLIPKNSDVIFKFLDLLKNKKHDYALFMSGNAVNIIFDIFDEAKKINAIVSTLNNIQVVAVGPHTKEALQKHSVTVAMMPKKYSSYGIIELFINEDVKNKKIVIPRSSAATNYLAKSLADLGMIVDELQIYDVKPAKHGKWHEFVQALVTGKIDCIVFTSASSVNSFFELTICYEKQEYLIEILNSINVVAIGPFTNNVLIEHGVDAVVADEHTLDGTLEVVVKLLGK